MTVSHERTREVGGEQAHARRVDELRVARETRRLWRRLGRATPACARVRVLSGSQISLSSGEAKSFALYLTLVIFPSARERMRATYHGVRSRLRAFKNQCGGSRRGTHSHCRGSHESRVSLHHMRHQTLSAMRPSVADTSRTLKNRICVLTSVPARE